ncbi:alpha/beta hydrolase [Thioclava marina]|uniref:alpha/beta hydrolase n=1 Tax=Thioclava marina TaxID=1915077 RepID=UPI00235802F0|nr:alpha/beta hydrolase-fold protein [Thioclava marina]
MRAGAFTLMGFLAVTGGEAHAQSAPDPGASLGAPITLARSASFDVDAPGGAMRVLVAWPQMPPPAEGYGVIYAMDAGWSFGSLHDVMARHDVVAPAGVVPSVIVAIGWPTPDLVDMVRRGRDLVGKDATGPGFASTLALLTDTVLPRVEAALPVDPRRRMVLGHSYGGAFALRAGFVRSDLFSHVAAGSPSIWTDPDWFLDPQRAVPGQKILIALGALEYADAAGAAGTSPERVARLRNRDMAGRAERMAKILDAQLVVFDGAGHGSSLLPFLDRAAKFLGE